MMEPPGRPGSSTASFSRGASAWLSEEDLAVYVAEFERTGFRGGLIRYWN